MISDRILEPVSYTHLPRRTKIMISDRILKQVNRFNYLGNDSGYDRNYDIDVELSLIHI